MSDRTQIDPGNRYPADGLLRVERLALRVLDHLPGAELERTRDVIQIDWGGEKGIVVVATPEAIELRLPTVEWTQGAYGPAASSRLWQRVRTDEMDNRSVQDLIDAALAARREAFHECRFCGRRFPPEHRFSEDVCHSCASKHFGVVYWLVKLGSTANGMGKGME